MAERLMVLRRGDPHAIQFPSIIFNDDGIVVLRSMTSLTSTFSMFCGKGTMILSSSLGGGYALHFVVNVRGEDCLINKFLPRSWPLWYELHVRDVSADPTAFEALKRRLLDDINGGGVWSDRWDYKEPLLEKAVQCQSLADVYALVELDEPDLFDD